MYSAISFEVAKTRLTTLEKIGQLFMPAAFINDTEDDIQKLEQLIKEHAIGGLCFFHSRASAATNFEGKKEVVRNESSFETLQALIKRYQKAAKYPLIIAIDAEWGLAMRIENTPQYPYAISLGAIQNKDNLIFGVGKNIAKDCKAAGIHWNLSPVVDINNNPKNPVIGYRSFGDDKEQVYQKARAYLNGMRSEGILGSIKHFPGHGDTATDSHLGLPVIDKPKEILWQNELYPFQKLIDEGVEAVMVGHLSVPALTDQPEIPSSINKDIIKGLLRGEMGFKGVVISDALNMHAVSKNYPLPGELEWLAFDAGNDVLCFSNHSVAGIEHIARNGSQEAIEASFERVWRLKQQLLSAVQPNETASLQPAAPLLKPLAEASLTWINGNEQSLANFREAHYAELTVDKDLINRLELDHSKAMAEWGAQLQGYHNVRLHIIPPQAKPIQNFGFTANAIRLINRLLEDYNVVLYHFGNPYALHLFQVELSWAAILAYQDFEAFREAAEQHFLGKVKALGQLPATLLPYEKKEL